MLSKKAEEAVLGKWLLLIPGALRFTCEVAASTANVRRSTQPRVPRVQSVRAGVVSDVSMGRGRMWPLTLGPSKVKTGSFEE